MRALAAPAATMVFAAVLLAAVPAWPRVIWDWDGSLGVGVEMNDNVDLVPVYGEELYENIDYNSEANPPKPRRDTIATVNPALSFSLEEEEDRLYLDYSGSYREYQENTHEPEWRHDLSAGLEFRRWEPFSLTATDRREMVPRSLDRPEEDVDNILDRNTLSFSPALSWDLSRTLEAGLAYREDRVSFPGELEADNSTSRMGSVFLRKRWTPYSENSVTVEGGTVERELTEDYEIFQAGLEGSGRLFFGVDIDYGLAWERRLYKEEEEPEEVEAGEAGEAGEEEITDVRRDEEFWTARALLSRRIARSGRFTLSWDMDVEDRFDGETVRTGHAETGLGWTFRGGSYFQAGAYHETRDFDLEDRRDREWGPTLEVRWAMTPWLALDLSGRWAQLFIGPSGADDTGEEGGDDIDENAEDQDEETIEDQVTRVEAALKLFLWEHVAVEAGFGYLNNYSTGDYRSYENNRFWLLITADTGSFGRSFSGGGR